MRRYIKNPKKINSTSVMPRYDLPQADLQALADFILSLDFSKQRMKTITRGEALNEKRD